MRKKKLHRSYPQHSIKRTRIDPKSLTQNQREEHLSQIDIPIIVFFTEEAHPEVFQRVRNILLASANPNIS